MGAPRRNRKKYTKPKDVYSLFRIESDRALIKEYGLKNMRELWKIQTEISKLRGNVRMLLAGTPGFKGVQENITLKLFNLGVINEDEQLDRLLDLKADDLLDRRLQSRVFKKGLARSMKQARQLITHGFVSIGGIKVDRPGYAVRAVEDARIGYYKPIEITPIKDDKEVKLEENTSIESEDINGKEKE